MANQQVPDFNAIALNMTNISIEEASLATQVGRMQNVANLNVGYQILQALAELSLRLDNRFNDIHTRLDACDYNWAARLENSYANYPMAPLTRLRTPQNHDLNIFPRDKAAIAGLNELEIDMLLHSYGLPATGDIELRKERFAKHIGIVTPLIH